MNSEFPFLSDKNVKYSGLSDANLNVSQGESIGLVLEKVVNALSQLIDRLNQCPLCDGEELVITDENLRLSGSYTQNSSIQSAPAKIQTVPTSGGIGLNVDLNSAIASLGEGASVLKVKTTVNGQRNGYPAQVASSDKTSFSINLRPDNFPANLESEIRYQDNSGEKTLKVRTPLSVENTTLNLPLQGGASGSVQASTQKDVNQNLQERVLQLENIVTQLNNINVSGFSTQVPSNASTQEAITSILTEIDSLKSQMNS